MFAIMSLTVRVAFLLKTSRVLATMILDRRYFRKSHGTPIDPDKVGQIWWHVD